MKKEKLFTHPEKNVVTDENLSLNNIPFNEVIKDWIKDYTNDIISIWDKSGKLLYISNAVQRILGYHPSDIVNWSWRKFLNKEDANIILKNIMNPNNKEYQIESQIPQLNGHYIWCHVTIIKHRDTQTKKEYYIGFIKDISAKKEVQRLISYSEKMSIAGKLATGIAHEIRNPLTSLKGFLQLLQSGVKEKDVYFDIMVEEIKKMEAITSELLYISKPISNNIQKEESIITMLLEVIELLRPEAKLKNIIIELDTEKAENIHIKGNKSEIKQVFINIIKNAIEAMDNQGTIHIIVSVICDEVRIDVIDEGIGIDDDQIQRLEEAFFTTKENGTGLGLVICKEIITRHQGTITYFQNKDKGSTFRIILPLLKR
ncbi:PAS domain-containing sensor histidine kinase [Cerasibacillus terrae]|nr:PAS domain-containing sensor histidine kinase [Cerasibacillus terrae]